MLIAGADVSAAEAEVVIAGTRYLVDIVDPPDPETSSWAHPGVCVTPDGTAWWAAPDGFTIRGRARDGSRASVVVDAIECHGLAADVDRGIWIADPGRKATAIGADVSRRIEPGRVTRVDSSGTMTHEIVDPGDGWRPSGIALHDYGSRSGGRIWVADGYGRSLVHCFSADGELLWSCDGSDSGTRFDTPHGIIVDDRGDRPRLLVADRGNARIVALTLDGSFVASHGVGELTSPSNFAISGALLWVTELFGAIVLLGADGKVAAFLGDAAPNSDPEWPNALADGQLAAPAAQDGGLRAPHGIAAGPDGEVFVTEWIIGGRVTKFAPAR